MKHIHILFMAILISLSISACMAPENVGGKGDDCETAGEGAAESTAAETQTSSESLEFGAMSENFYFIIEDVFSIKGKDGVVVVGVNQNSPLYSDTEVDINFEDHILQAEIGDIEVYERGITTGVPAETNVGLLLKGITADQVGQGGLITLRGAAEVSNQIKAAVYLYSGEEAEREVRQIGKGDSVFVMLWNDMTGAVVTEIWDQEGIPMDLAEPGSVAFLAFKSNQELRYAPEQAFRLFDENEEEIGVGRLTVGAD